MIYSIMLFDGKTFRSFSPILGMKGCKSTEYLSMVLRYSTLNNAACPKRRGKVWPPVSFSPFYLLYAVAILHSVDARHG